MNKRDLDLKTTVDYAKEIYGDAKTPTETGVFTHCWSVAKLAEQIAQKLFAEIRAELLPQDASEIIAAIVHSSFLLESINVGRRTFENIADIANVQVAAMVSTLSRDYRLVETKRDIEYRGRLSQSSVSSHIVAVASILCSAQETINALKKHGLLHLPKTRKILAQLDADLLVIHTAARYYALRIYVHAARNLIIDSNQLIKKLKADVKAAKSFEKIAANIECKKAAKTAIADSEPSLPKERKSRGKARTAKKSAS